ncbi:MAG: hypothetical protein K8S56_04980 [Candidatus Cloacimonetes bacterium]|nr:hypothetical protein [Candidatus Cloacimonadota bacterium]
MRHVALTHAKAILIIVAVVGSLFFFSQMSGAGYTHHSLQITSLENNGNPGWVDNINSGMPRIFLQDTARIPWTDTLLNKLNSYRTLLLMIIGASGMYLFLLHRGFLFEIALMGGLAFGLTHFPANMPVFGSAMFLPWLMMAIDYLRNHRNLMGFGLTAITFFSLVRENAPDFAAATLLWILFYVLVTSVFPSGTSTPLQRLLALGLTVFALTLGLAGVADPMLEKLMASGEISSATFASLSNHTGKFDSILLLITQPHNFISRAYWLNISHYFIGSVVVFSSLLFLIIAGKEKRKQYMLLTIPLLAALVMPALKLQAIPEPVTRELFFPFLAMMLVLLFAEACMYIYVKSDKLALERQLLKTLLIFGIMFVVHLLLSAILLAGEESAGIYDMVFQDGTLAWFLAIVLIAIIWVITRFDFSQFMLLLVIAIILLIDIGSYTLRHKASSAGSSSTTQNLPGIESYLKQDTDTFRIYAPGKYFNDARLTSMSSIGGYSGSMLNRYREVIDYCLNTEIINRNPLNWNIVDMLNVKYVVYDKKLPFSEIEYSHYDRDSRITVYRNKNWLSRLWFVDSLVVITNKRERLDKLNSVSFKPRYTAIVESLLPKISAPDTLEVNLLKASGDTLTATITVNTNAFMVISEIFYRHGWKCCLDGIETTIYPVNQCLRGVYIPAGTHLLEMYFEPETNTYSVWISISAILAMLLSIVIGIFLYLRKNYRGKREFYVNFGEKISRY